jgi:ABC-type polysaccharide/polyol phosphate transport system ATPase subunit
MDRARIVVFATHGLDTLPSFCERTIFLLQGRVIADGPSPAVIDRYRQHVATAEVDQ